MAKILTGVIVAIVTISLLGNYVPHSAQKGSGYPAERWGISVGAANNSIALQSAINELSAGSGGNIVFGEGTYVFLDSVELKAGVSLTGSYYGKDNVGTILSFEPTSGKKRFMYMPAVTGYNSGIKITGFHIKGNANSKTGIDLYHPEFVEINRVQIDGLDPASGTNGFDFGMVIDGSISSVFRDLLIRSCDTNAVLFKKTTFGNTTTNFYNCYFRDSPTLIVALQETTTGVNFTDCIFESSVNGIDSYVGNSLSFNTCYSENIPDGNVAGYMFQIGINGTVVSVPSRGVVKVFGGNYGGSNSGINANSQFMRIDETYSLGIYGVDIRRYNTVFTTDTGMRHVVYDGNTTTQVSGLGTIVTGSEFSSEDNKNFDF